MCTTFWFKAIADFARIEPCKAFLRDSYYQDVSASDSASDEQRIRRIDDLWWRCGKECSDKQIYILKDGWICPNCGRSCDEQTRVSKLRALLPAVSKGRKLEATKWRMRTRFYCCECNLRTGLKNGRCLRCPGRHDRKGCIDCKNGEDRVDGGSG
jgi:hypothetical protein